MLAETPTLRIYAGDLAAYNAGILHGAWIDLLDNGAAKSADDLQAEIWAMLRRSPCPNVRRARYHCAECDESVTATVSYDAAEPAPTHDCEHCGEPAPLAETFASAEEWAVHDYDGAFPSFGEYPGLDALVTYAELVVDAGDDRDLPADAVCAIVDHFGRDYIDEAREAIEDRYHGHYSSLVEYAEQYADDVGLFENVNDTVRRYFDFEAFARDMELGGDVITIEGDGGIYVFGGH